MTDKERREKRRKRVAIAMCAMAVGVLGLWFSRNVNVEKREIPLIPYPEYMSLLEKGEVNTVVYNEENKYMTISLHNEATRKMTEAEREETEYDTSLLRRVYYPEGENFKKELLERGVVVVEGGETVAAIFEKYGDVFAYLIMLLLIVGLMFRSSAITMGGNVAMKVKAGEIGVSFDDVIGHEEIKKDLRLLVRQLQDGSTLKDLSHGILFEGEAGTGKTMLAKAVASEAGVNFISVNSSSLIQMYVGLGAKRVRDIFSEARKNAPCVLFFDELDAVGAKRGSQHSHREHEQTINALLTEMDGFESRGDILVIAATNRADNLDEALVRAGRFDRKVRIGIPKDWQTRKQLFDHYLKTYPLADDTDTEVLAKQTVGFSGADIAAVCREARLVMFSHDSDSISQDNLEEAIDKAIFHGNRSDTEEHMDALKIKAYHEAGHAVMNMICGKPVSRISVVGMTSGVGGAVFQSDDERVFRTKRDFEEQIMVCYAGRASEELRFGAENVTDGAENDIAKATELLMTYAGQCGFDEQTGLLNYDIITKNIIAENDIVKRVGELSRACYSRTVQLLRENYSKVEILAERLTEVKTLSGKEMQELFDGKENA